MKRPRYRWFVLAVRVIVGAVFIYAGALKIGDPLQFADNIASFRLLPAFAVNALFFGSIAFLEAGAAARVAPLLERRCKIIAAAVAANQASASGLCA